MAQGVFWVGQDGNVWVKDEYGTRNMGNPGPQGDSQFFVQNGKLVDKYADYPGQPGSVMDYDMIADPVVNSSAPRGTTGGSALNMAAINNTQAAIDQIPGLLEAALAAERQRFQNTVGGFDAQEKAQRGTYNQSTITNQQNYDANFMDAIRAGIKGLGGVMGILRGTGAAGGSIEGDARNVVGGVTASDIRGGADTQRENQTALDSSLSTFLTDLGIKRRANEDTFTNNERAIRRDSATQLQDLFSKMAGYYGDAGRTADRDTWMSKAGALTPEIAQNSRTQVSAYDQTPVQVKAPELTAFSGPTQPNVVTAPSGGQVGSGIFTMTDRRRERQSAPVGA